jgi:photosystem II cytochrome c550
MMLRKIFFSFLLILVVASPLGGGSPANAAKVDPYFARYLRITEPVEIQQDDQGQTQRFSLADLSIGKRLFDENCKTCHFGGTTLPNPIVSLGLPILKGATPPRDNVKALVAYLRQPMAYNNSESIDLCRQIPETWLPNADVERLSAYVLTRANRDPRWAPPMEGAF